MWPAIVAASLFGLIAWGIIITIRTLNGESEITAPVDKPFKADLAGVPVKYSPYKSDPKGSAAAPSQGGTPPAPSAAEPKKSEPPAPERLVSPPDPVPTGSVWVGLRLFPRGPVQECELKITSRGKTQFEGGMTLLDLPGEALPFTFKVNGNIVRENVKFSSENVEKFQQNFVGHLSGKEMAW